MIALTEEQQAIAGKIEAFIRARNPAKSWFCYTGAAGTGKTHLLSYLARKYPAATLCTFTGKAASVIARKSGMPAQTIHSALYRCYGEDTETQEIKFGRKVKDGDWSGKLVLVDEASTVSNWLAGDLLATGCKVIACGDDGQLQPVKGRAFFTDAPVDAKLTEIHRQAWDSAIIRQAHSVRNGDGYRADGPDFRIVREVGRDDLLGADIVLCWRNATRVALNRLIRAHRGLGGIAKRGEPIMALRNAPEWGILNGAVYTLLEDHVGGTRRVAITNERGEDICVEKAWIEDMEAPVMEEGSNPFCFAYSATVHKAQGSEYETVILVDEYDRDDQRDRWLYTGVTRSSKSIIVQRFW